MPDIENEIWQKYKDQDVLVIGVHRGEDPQLLADFIAQTGVTFPIVQDTNTLGLLAFPPGVRYPYPRDVVIGKDLKVAMIRNSFNVAEMDAKIQALLAR